MSVEDNLKQKLEGHFPFLKDAVVIKRTRRMFLDVRQERLFEVLDYLINEMQFTHLCTITGMDELESFGVIYHLSREGQIILSLRIHISHDRPKIKTVTGLFLEADAYERELDDLLGIEVEGLAPGHRYPLPDNWPKGDHPLRKDWKLKSEEKHA
jgi:NADH:ubiquinone oxidoreductase subunit C